VVYIVDANLIQHITEDPKASPVRPPQSSIPDGPSAIRKALATSSQAPESAPDSRSQSPDSMKMSTPEPSEPPSAPLPNGVANNSESLLGSS